MGRLYPRLLIYNQIFKFCENAAPVLVAEVRGAKKSSKNPWTLEGEVDARHLIEVVEDHQCRRVVDQRDSAGLQPAALLPAWSRRNSFSSRTSSSFQLMYHPLCHMVHSSTSKSPLEAP